MAFKFTEDNFKKIEEAKAKYPTTLAAVMDACYIGQEQNGYISDEVMEEIENLADNPFPYGKKIFKRLRSEEHTSELQSH